MDFFNDIFHYLTLLAFYFLNIIYILLYIDFILSIFFQHSNILTRASHHWCVASNIVLVMSCFCAKSGNYSQLSGVVSMVAIPDAALDNRAILPEVSLQRKYRKLFQTDIRFDNQVYKTSPYFCATFDQAYNTTQTRSVIGTKRLMPATIDITKFWSHGAWVQSCSIEIIWK